MALIRSIDTDRSRQTIVGAVAAIGNLLGIRIIAEGVEQAREALVLHHLGISLMQGYLFAKPGYETLPQVDFDMLTPMIERRAGAA
jgi:EAL domain-containing protein (putative c-di-GMP-specific phosphodiesterase class I)